MTENANKINDTLRLALADYIRQNVNKLGRHHPAWSMYSILIQLKEDMGKTHNKT
jgi:hypothetical protein